MILEVADIRIRPGEQEAFETAIRDGLDSVVVRAAGFRGYKVNRGVESAERYILMIFWETLESHTVDFRESDLFTRWREIVGPYFAEAPQVEHFTLVAKSSA